MKQQPNTPHLIVAINDLSEMTLTHVRSLDEHDPFTTAFPLHELNTIGLDETIKRVGGAVFSSMTNLHPEPFAPFPSLHIPYHAQLDLDQISYLISAAIRLHTKNFTPVIDKLVDELAKNDPKAMESTFIKSWPDVRLQLEKNPD
jgi:hypothetical protein